MKLGLQLTLCWMLAMAVGGGYAGLSSYTFNDTHQVAAR